jgi:hypothetical protein
MKNNFNSFFGILLALSTANVAAIIYHFFSLSRLTHHPVDFGSYLIVSPVIIFVEAIIYWRFRKGNVFRKISWTYSSLLILSCSALFLADIVLENHDNIAPHWKPASYYPIIMVVQNGLFLLTAMAAHILFIILLVRINSRKFDQKHFRHSDNLLDDVLT